MEKKIFLLLALLLQMTVSFGQYSSSNPQYDWGNWTQNSCYQGIYIRVQKAYFNKGANQWFWNWEIQNRYNTRVAISWAFYGKAQGTPGITNSRHTFEANEIRSNTHSGGESEISWILNQVCFKFIERNGSFIPDCSDDPGTNRKGSYYANCDTGLPNYQIYNGGNKVNASSPVSQTSESTSKSNSAESGSMPEFPGGTSQAYVFIQENLIYPKEAQENDTKGTVYVKFTVEIDGSLSNLVILKDPGHGLGAEVLRVLKMMPKWKPGTVNGKPAAVSFTIPVKFN